METFVVLIARVLSGVVLVLNVYVILRYIRQWNKSGENLLPLHVWLIASSYFLLVVSFITKKIEVGGSFYMQLLALCLGTYSMWILSGYQSKKERRL